MEQSFKQEPFWRVEDDVLTIRLRKGQFQARFDAIDYVKVENLGGLTVDTIGTHVVSQGGSVWVTEDDPGYMEFMKMLVERLSLNPKWFEIVGRPFSGKSLTMYP